VFCQVTFLLGKIAKE